MARVNKTTGIFLILGVIILITSVTAAWYVESQQLPSLPRKETPEDKLDVSAGGTVDVRSRLSHPSPVVPGVVTTVEVKEGQRVTKGQVLVRQDDSLPRMELGKAKSALALAKFDINAAKNAISEHKLKITLQEGRIRAAVDELNKAKEAYEQAKKAQDLSADGRQKANAAELTVNQASEKLKGEQSTLETLKDNPQDYLLETANTRVKYLEKQVMEAEDALENYIVRARANGRIFRLNVSVGDHFASPVPNMEPRITFCPDEELIVRAEINQEYGSEVREGQIAIISLHGSISTKSWTGKVESLGPWVHRPRSPVFEPEVINDARFRECVIRFDQQPSEQDLVVGTRLRIQIKMSAAE
jgi:multidrug resistance efflux pump